jgi:hypothetical protein
VAEQLRDYRVRAGELDRFVELWQERIAPLRRACGFEIAGAWTVPAESRFIWILRHSDGWKAFEAADAAYFTSPERTSMSPDPARLIEEQHNVPLNGVDVP